MGWGAYTKAGELLSEECHHQDCPEPTQHTDFCIHPECPDPNLHGRPVEKGNNGELLCVTQEAYGYKVAIDLKNGAVIIGYDEIKVQNGDLEITGPNIIFWVAEETNIIGDYKHLEQEFVFARDDEGKRILHEGKYVKIRNDILTDLTWRPIWFKRHISTLPAPIEVIGVQTTTPKSQGERNVKKLITLFPDGRLGID